MKKFKLKGEALVQKHCAELLLQAQRDGLPFRFAISLQVPSRGIAMRRFIIEMEPEKDPQLMTIKHYQEESQKFLNRMHGGIWGKAE